MYEKVNNWFDIATVEKRVLDFWKKKRIFYRLVEKNRDGAIWSFLDGPITANDQMGLHHAWGRALKDAFQRYHAMNGKRLRYQNGFDCQGLWVEVEVEKELGLKSKKDIEKYGIAQFIRRCKERVKKYAGIITEQSVRLGYWMDWENSYYTMSDENNYTIWSFLKKCHEKGYIYKGHDVMPWCPRCGTGISQHEIQEGYRDVRHLAIVAEFLITQRPNEAFLVWTTTPWTLTANVALAVHPDLPYVRVKQNKRIYYLIKSRMEEILTKRGTWEILQELSGREIVDLGFTYKSPFDELSGQKETESYHRVIGWKDVSAEEGTGIVHIAPGCGAEDFGLGNDFGLPAICPIDESGRFTKDFDWLAGREASKVAREINAHLKEKGMLYSSSSYLHSYPHCWRCKHELLFRLVDEWYIAMDPWRDTIKRNVKKIRWIPPFGKDLELDWLTNMQDWMISKKRYWGLALPIWECSECTDFQVIGSYEELRSRAVEGWDKFEGHNPHRPWIDQVELECPKCGKTVRRIPEVGNPWLDAGIVPYSTADYNSNRKYWKQWIPADLVLECFPGQFRNWFYSLLAMSTMMENIPPFKTLVGHALVKDEKGKEMHKTAGNALWFNDAADELGADVIRWLFYENDLTTNIHFSQKEARRVRGKFFNTLWNCYAFYVNYARLIDFSPSQKPSNVTKRPKFDRWILSKLQKIIETCRNGFEDYDLRTVNRSLTEFVDNLSNWYIRHNRRRFWKAKKEEDSYYEFETLYECLYVLIRLIAPMLPMLTETMYQNLVRSVNTQAPLSIHLTEYPIANREIVDQKLIDQMEAIMQVETAGLAARQKAGIKTRQPLSRLTITVTKSEDKETVIEHRDLLLKDLNIKKIEILEANTDFSNAELEGKSVVQYDGGCVSLDTTLTKELIREGMMREFLRKAQMVRKKVGLEIEDRIYISYRCESSELKSVIEDYREYISKELLCLEMKENKTLEDGEEINVLDNTIVLKTKK